MSNISATCGRPDMRFFWKPERRSFTHSKSHARLPSVTFFPEPFGDLKTIHVGGRTETAKRLSENHLQKAAL
jgi:hypothetical protein